MTWPAVARLARNNPDAGRLRDALALRDVFRKHGAVDPAPPELATLVVLVAMIRTAPRLLSSPEAQESGKAMRALGRLLPPLQAQAEALAAQARAAGIDTYLGRYADAVATLLTALEPFDAGRRDARGWWHGYAQLAALDVRLVFHRHGKRAGFAKPTAHGAMIVAGVMELAELRGISPDTVAEALRAKRKKVGNFVPKLPAVKRTKPR